MTDRHATNSQKKFYARKTDVIASDFIGQKFHKVTVISQGERPKLALMECECGKRFVDEVSKFRGGHKKSCGCNYERHGKAVQGMKIPEYGVWCNMLSRCNDPKAGGYRNYGGRGIKVCDRWFYSFKSFLDDMGERPTPKHTLERVDNDGNYEPLNCKWATREEQGRNRRNTHPVFIKGVRHSFRSACKEIGVSYSAERCFLERASAQEIIDARLRGDFDFASRPSGKGPRRKYASLSPEAPYLRNAQSEAQ